MFSSGQSAPGRRRDRAADRRHGAPRKVAQRDGFGKRGRIIIDPPSPGTLVGFFSNLLTISQDIAKTLHVTGSSCCSGEDVARRRSLDDPSTLRGAAPLEVIQLIPKNWIQNRIRNNLGTRYSDPERLGNQIRIMEGNPRDPDLIKRGPYLVISMDGQRWRVPLKGNPTLG
jgi:hypothetical protein